MAIKPLDRDAADPAQDRETVLRQMLEHADEAILAEMDDAKRPMA